MRNTATLLAFFILLSSALPLRADPPVVDPLAGGATSGTSGGDGTAGTEVLPLDQQSAVITSLLTDLARAKNLDPKGVDALLARVTQNMSQVNDPDLLDYFGTKVGPYLEKLQKAKSEGRGYTAEGNDHRSPVTEVLGRGLPNQLISVAPENPNGWSRRGQVLNGDQNWTEGFSDFSKALELGAKDANTYAGYAAAAFNLGDTKLAAEAAAMALSLDPNHAGALAIYKLAEGRAPKVTLPSALGLGAGRQPIEDGNTPSAFESVGGPGGMPGEEGAGQQLTAAQVAAEIQRQASAPATPGQKSAGLTRSASSSLAVKDYSSAHALASKAIEFNGKNAQAWTYRAIANNKMRRYPDSVSDASSALTYAPGSAAALQTRSNSFSRMQRFHEGLADANRTLEVQPRNGQAYFNRAFALAGLGERGEALESLRQAAEVDPRFKPRYEEAVQAPSDADLMFLFDDKPSAVVVRSAPPSAQTQKKRFLRLMLTTVMGGILVALGLLHILSASWREKVRNTIRRVLAESPEAAGASSGVATGDAPAARPPANGFWGQYTLSREIGSGGMGIVYEARDNSLDRRVAVKKMRDEIRVDPQERRRFINEARTVASLHHPHIVDIYAIVEEESDVYLVFEYVDGTTLSELISSKGHVPFEEARRILKSVCAAVESAHRQNVIHRDLKPSNIMLTGEGVVKVMDFGVARQAKDAMTKMSMTNTIVGTPPYMAPEQEQGTVRKESDVFALGICFYELLTGKLPFSGQGAGMLLNKINGKHTPASSVRPELSAELDAVLAKALCPDPDKRYRTPAEFMAAVEALSPVAAG